MPINNGQFNAYANYPGMQNQQNQVQFQQAPQSQQFGSMNYNQTMGLSIAQINDDAQVNSYPVAAGNTVLLINFNTQKFFLKSTNVNGVPMPVQAAEWNYVQQAASVQANQNGGSGVTREEFDELKAMLAQALSTRSEQRQSRKFNGGRRGGNGDVQSGNDAADNG